VKNANAKVCRRVLLGKCLTGWLENTGTWQVGKELFCKRTFIIRAARDTPQWQKSKPFEIVDLLTTFSNMLSFFCYEEFKNNYG
jgi:hypothetical protein